MDLWGGDSTSLNHLLRLRTATIRVDWANTSVSVGQDKPLISPRDPDSLAQVAFSPFTAAGNPWLWQPQVRVERRFNLTESSGVRLQGSLYQTRESFSNLPTDYQSSTSAGSRPGWEGRAEYWKNWGDKRKLEVASGFHTSFSKVDEHIGSVRCVFFRLAHRSSSALGNHGGFLSRPKPQHLRRRFGYHAAALRNSAGRSSNLRLGAERLSASRQRLKLNALRGRTIRPALRSGERRIAK